MRCLKNIVIIFNALNNYIVSGADAKKCKKVMVVYMLLFNIVLFLSCYLQDKKNYVVFYLNKKKRAECDVEVLSSSSCNS